ncbi:1-aminocyclopropane-1-carboxylate deaminase/D-cysteine desulfhydrase [Mesorhizobium sp. INR15]|uniref:1-aminocyclopropane-1-carboxylate deaminase/D-cysteine desulfhydrase n=1 Tax=Mesorhizobium sp. INR15 TaxID=2654248 RepID=UPI001896700A|nr:D-cysteine desulfhydrase family protein [Mesorhizobium sp. INR15]QPC95838.1 pyridoxal-phosphate dependent enzyme [Mesorhizobium sp. INR15]
MFNEPLVQDLKTRLGTVPRFALAQLPTPLQPLHNFGKLLNGPELWMKRDDLSGLQGGGNKTRKLEFLTGDALRKGCDMLVTVGAIQSNHTRQTAAAAAKAGMKCSLLHCAWTKDAGPNYRHVGNILLSHLMGAELYIDETQRPIEDQGPLAEFMEHLRSQGHKPYLIPGGASEHRLGSMGYMNCAIELATQMQQIGQFFDYLVHTTGSSSTQSGLVAGFKALGIKTRIIGVADDGETEIKARRVRQLANEALQFLELPELVEESDVTVVASNMADYGYADAAIKEGIHLMATREGLIADPVYEGRAIRGLLDLSAAGRFEPNAKILLMHLGGAPAIHAYAGQFGDVVLTPFNA